MSDNCTEEEKKYCEKFKYKNACKDGKCYNPKRKQVSNSKKSTSAQKVPNIPVRIHISNCAYHHHSEYLHYTHPNQVDITAFFKKLDCLILFLNSRIILMIVSGFSFLNFSINSSTICFVKLDIVV